MKNINIYQKSITAYFAVVACLWAYIQVTGHNQVGLQYLYSLVFGFIPLFSGLIGLDKSRLWGGLKSAVGRAIFFFSLGLVLWGIGETIWSYYNFVIGVAAPYPSIADLGFAPSIFFWIIGILYFSKATGASFALRKSHKAKFIALAAPIILIAPSYYLEVVVARGGVIFLSGESVVKTILDIAYPFGDFLAVTVAAVILILSHKFLGGVYRRAVLLLLLGLAVMYVGDLIFSYTTTNGSYYNADFGDLVLAIGLYILSIGILAFASKPALKSVTREQQS